MEQKPVVPPKVLDLARLLAATEQNVFDDDTVDRGRSEHAEALRHNRYDKGLGFRVTGGPFAIGKGGKAAGLIGGSRRPHKPHGRAKNSTQAVTTEQFAANLEAPISAARDQNRSDKEMIIRLAPSPHSRFT
jgi:hypothetical protein